MRRRSPGITLQQAKELYPEGRDLYYEGPMDELPAFMRAMNALGIDVSVRIHVPPEHLPYVYGRWEVGS